MPFLPQHRKSRIKVFAPLLMIVGAALFLVALAPASLTSAFLTFSTPLLRARAQVSEVQENITLRLKSDETLEEENKRLRDEVARLRVRAALYEAATERALRLEELFGRTRTQGLLAHVLASPAASPYDTLILDVGSADGVEIGYAVLFDGTMAAGVIEAAGEHASRARLFSSPDLTHNVTVGTSTTPLVAVGKGGGMFTIEAPRDVVATPGMAVFKNGDTNALAFVVESRAESSDSFQTIYAIFPINLFETREVIVEATPLRAL